MMIRTTGVRHKKIGITIRLLKQITSHESQITKKPLFRGAFLLFAEAAVRFFGKMDVSFVKIIQSILNRAVNRLFWINAAFVRLTGFDSGQNLDAVIDRINRPDMELAFVHRFENILPQHQIRHIGPRNDNAVLAGQPLTDTDIKKALDFLIDAANRLDIAKLVD